MIHIYLSQHSFSPQLNQTPCSRTQISGTQFNYPNTQTSCGNALLHLSHEFNWAPAAAQAIIIIYSNRDNFRADCAHLKELNANYICVADCYAPFLDDTVIKRTHASGKHAGAHIFRPPKVTAMTSPHRFNVIIFIYNTIVLGVLSVPAASHAPIIIASLACCRRKRQQRLQWTWWEEWPFGILSCGAHKRFSILLRARQLGEEVGYAVWQGRQDVGFWEFKYNVKKRNLYSTWFWYFSTHTKICFSYLFKCHRSLYEHNGGYERPLTMQLEKGNVVNGINILEVYY